MNFNISEMQLIGKGNTAQVFLYSEDKILKLFNSNIDKNSTFREYNIALYIQTVIKNVAKVFSIEQIQNQYGIIYEKINGPNMLEQLFSLSLKEDSDKLCKTFAQLHYELHSKKVSQNDKNIPIPTVKEKLITEIQLVSELSTEEKDKIIHYTKNLPDGNSICHFDFYPGNILLQNNEPIIIDWMTACYGDFCADIARTILLLKYGEMINAPKELEVQLKNVQKQALDIYQKEYIEKFSIKNDDIEKWILPVAAARLHESITDNERKILISIVKENLE